MEAAKVGGAQIPSYTPLTVMALAACYFRGGVYKNARDGRQCLVSV